MVKKITEKIALMILFALLLGTSAPGDNSFTGSDILLFENYYQNGIKFPDEYLLLKRDIYRTDSLLVTKEGLLQAQAERITGELFNLLCGLDVINGWSIYKELDINPYSAKHEKFIEKRKNELELFYLGQLRLSKNFNSFLILVSNSNNDDYNVIKTVFLVNVRANKLTSITRISNYICVNGHSNYIYTELSENVVFLQKDTVLSSDVIFSDAILENELQREDGKIEVKFIYDRNGFLKTL